MWTCWERNSAHSSFFPFLCLCFPSLFVKKKLDQKLLRDSVQIGYLLHFGYSALFVLPCACLRMIRMDSFLFEKKYVVEKCKIWKIMTRTRGTEDVRLARKLNFRENVINWTAFLRVTCLHRSISFLHVRVFSQHSWCYSLQVNLGNGYILYPDQFSTASLSCLIMYIVNCLLVTKSIPNIFIIFSVQLN